MAQFNHANQRSSPPPPTNGGGPTIDQPAADPSGDPAATHDKDSAAPRIVGRRYHPYLPSVLYIVVTLFIGIGAFNAQNNLLFFVFGVTLATLVVSGIISGTMMMGVSVRRVIDGSAEVGKQAPISYRVTNLNRRLPLFALKITEWDDAPTRRKRGPGQGDEATSNGRLGSTRAFAAFVPRGGSIVVPARAHPLRAGSAVLRGFEVSTVFPFGIAMKSVRFAQRAMLTIQHPMATLSGDVLAALDAAGRAQRHAAHASRAEGEEFFGIREYTPGDPMRLIAWRASARSGDLRTRVQASPPRASVRLVLTLDGINDEPIAVSNPDAPPKPDDPLGRALGWPLRVFGFIDDEPEEPLPTLSLMDRALALSGSLAAALLGRGFAVEVVESNERFAAPMGSGARQRDLILDTLALRRGLSERPADGRPSPARRADRSAVGLTVRLSTDANDAGGTSTGSTSGGTIAWSYDQIDEALATMASPRATPAQRAAYPTASLPMRGGLAAS